MCIRDSVSTQAQQQVCRYKYKLRSENFEVEIPVLPGGALSDLRPAARNCTSKIYRCV